jgi:iron complex transport system substrate-binding protein
VHGHPGQPVPSVLTGRVRVGGWQPVPTVSGMLAMATFPTFSTMPKMMPTMLLRMIFSERGRSLVWMLLLLLSGGVANSSASGAEGQAAASKPLRLISLNPSLTAIVLRLGAADSLVGVDDYSAQVLPEVADRPTVGGLFDPSLERVVALRPDRVLIVAGVDQQSHAERLEKMGIEVEIFRNERLEEVLENIERIGALLARDAAAADRIGAILEMRAAVAVAARGRERPSTLAIITRTPLFVVGADTFLDEMLEAVGARNLGRRLGKGYPSASIEWLIGVAPELLLDLTPGAERAADFWARWPSLPAVRANRVVDVDASRISLPGPDLDRALRALAVVVHGESISVAIDKALHVAGVGAEHAVVGSSFDRGGSVR